MKPSPPAAPDEKRLPLTKLLTHAGALLLGAFLTHAGVQTWQRFHGGSGGEDAEMSPPANADEAGGKGPRFRSAQRSSEIRTGSASEYRAVWRELNTQRLSKSERLKAETALLQKWARVDLEGALQAALSEEWDDPLFISANKQCPLAKAFYQVFCDQPEQSWKILQSGRLGTGGRLFEEALLAQVIQSKPKFAVSLLPEVDSSQRLRILQQTLGSLSPEDQQAALRTVMAVKAFPEERNRLLGQVMAYLPPNEDLSTLRSQWTTQPEGPERDIAMATWAVRLAQSGAEWTDELAQLPADQRLTAARTLIGLQTDGSPLSSRFIPALDALIAAGDWSSLSKFGRSENSTSDPFSPSGDVAMKDWAMALPAQPELAGIYRGAMRSFASQDPAAFQAALEALPPGDWHRDQGLVILATSSYDPMSPQETDKYLDQITDPEAKKAVIDYRYNIEIRSSRPVTR